MYIHLVDLHIFNTYHVPTYKENIILFTVSKHSTTGGCFVFKYLIGPTRVQ